MIMAVIRLAPALFSLLSLVISFKPCPSALLCSNNNNNNNFLSLLFLKGDEILSVNEESLVGLSHAEAIAVFKRIKSGDVVLTVVRRSSTR